MNILTFSGTELNYYDQNSFDSNPVRLGTTKFQSILYIFIFDLSIATFKCHDPI